jgi:hypothetical protein
MGVLAVEATVATQVEGGENQIRTIRTGSGERNMIKQGVGQGVELVVNPFLYAVLLCKD